MPGVVAEQPAQAKARKPTKNEQRRAKKKEQKREISTTPAPEAPSSVKPVLEEADANHPPQPIEPEYDDPIQDVPDVEEDYISLAVEDPLYEQFAGVFAKFREQDDADAAVGEELEKPEVFFDDDDNIQGEDEEEETQKRLSKKARKAANKLSIAELKAIVRKPETVDWTDTSAQHPKLLVNIKSARNVVPVPNHWSLKREYLSSKRGIEKPGFALPKFIAETGISEMRDAVLEKQADASLKQKQRERVQPKMGKLDIDYQKLYEAFFRRQTKPQLTRYGEVYYEGKEYETNLRHLRPGELSDALKEALNMPPGAPPPWLINQQKVGPPPSYPAMKIFGLNAPPPPGGQWGFHPGGFGKPPLNEQNQPLWGGDLFGYHPGQGGRPDEEKEEEVPVAPVDKKVWGELQPLQEEEEEEDDEGEDEDEDGDDEDAGAPSGLETPFGGTETPGGITSTVPTEFGTHSMAEEFNLRKARRGTETEESAYHRGPPRAAGQVLQERSIRAEGFFGGERAYDIGSGGQQQQQQQNPAHRNVPVLGEERGGGGSKKRKMGDLDVSVDVDALERDDRLSKDEVKRQFETQRVAQQQQQGGWQGGGVGVFDQAVSDLVAEESARMLEKEKERKRRKR